MRCVKLKEGPLNKKAPPIVHLETISRGIFLNNYDVTRVKTETAEICIITSTVQKTFKNRKKITYVDYFFYHTQK